MPETQFDDYWRSSTHLSSESLGAIGRENFAYRAPANWAASDIPTLLLAGSTEPRLVHTGMRALHSGRPGSEFEIIEGVGHGVPLERPEWFGERLARFIAGSAANMQ